MIAKEKFLVKFARGDAVKNSTIPYLSLTEDAKFLIQELDDFQK